MSTSTHAHKETPVQQKVAHTAASVLDASSQSESLQRKADMVNNAAQRTETPRPNNTGMPDDLKSGIESLSGFSMDNVRVHYNSSKPATVQALAYTQGTDIHVAPGQEKHLPHEAWHVAQQMAGRVSPTTNINGMPVNDNAGLEHEADIMGENAAQFKLDNNSVSSLKNQNSNSTMQMVTEENTDVDEFEDVEIVNVSEPRYLKKEREARKKYLILYLENGSDKEHFHVKKNAEDAENRRIQKGAEVKKIDLIGLYTSSTDISDLENIVIISHGEQISPKKTDNKFAECTAKQLADDIFFHIKKEGELIKYQGEIFLDGCYTGEPIKKLYDGTSYAERFGQALKKNITDYNEKLSHGEANLGLYFTVKGNLGSAIIQDDGRQMTARIFRYRLYTILSAYSIDISSISISTFLSKMHLTQIIPVNHMKP